MTSVFPDLPPLSWDYSTLAPSYNMRADYHDGLIDEVLQAMHLNAETPVLDVGAGTGKLTKVLCNHGLNVIAAEPNVHMRDIALSEPAMHRARWIAARGEALPLADGSVQLVAYGSSFNVLMQTQALAECARVLQPGGHWMALWNHRDLDDPLQSEVEALIRHHIPHYDPGTRRNAPDAAVRDHPSFSDVQAVERRFVTTLATQDWLRAWRSHATLQRQAEARLPEILNQIDQAVSGQATVQVPYYTRIWIARTAVA